MVNIGERIQVARKSRGWTQSELAVKAGVSRSTIAMWEQGKREPDFDSIEALADVFNCSLSYLIEDEDATPKDDELWEMREAIRRNPEIRALFKLSKNATTSDIRAAIAVLESLRGTRDE